MSAAEKLAEAVDPRTVGIRYSRLKLMGQSPLHYWHACQRDDSGQTLAMRLGSGGHALLFNQPLAVYEDRRAGKAWEAFQAEHADRPILNPREYEQAKAMRDAVMANPLAASLLFAPGVDHEKRLTWSRNGRQCFGTPDAVGDGYVVELKTTRSAEPEKFVRDATWRGYHAQLAWYAAAMETLGRQVSDLYIVAVESTPPCPVTVLRLETSAWLAGNALIGGWWERLRICEEANHWPGYTDAMVRFGVEEGGDRLIVGGEEMEF